MVSNIFEIPLERILFDASPQGRSAAGRPIVTRRAFVGSDENRLVPTVMQSLLKARLEGQPWLFSPLLICGSTGTGKSLLAHCLAGQWLRDAKTVVAGSAASNNAARQITAPPIGGRAVWMSTGVDFCRSFAQAVKDDVVDQWRDRCRATPLFVLDDLQQMQKRMAAQRELVLLLDDLDDKGTPAILTSPTPAAASDVLYPQLASRLSAGLTIDLQPPGVAARYQIVRTTIDEQGLSVADAAVRWFAERYGGTVPHLKNRLLGCFSVHQQSKGSVPQKPHPARSPATTRSTISQQQLKSLVEQWESRQRFSLKDISRTVGRYCQVSRALLLGSSRKQHVVLARSLAMNLAKRSGYSLREIGHYFSDRDHSTVLHACQKIDRQIKTDPTTRNAIDELRQILANETSRQLAGE